MDTSETYIKMMGAAWPILKPEVENHIGLTLFSRRQRMLYVLDGKVVPWRDKINTSNCDRAYPLLEQDQLQAMVEYGKSPPSMIHLFHDFMESEYPSEDITLAEIEFESWEQLWLAFVMKEKYQGIWNRGEWVKER